MPQKISAGEMPSATEWNRHVDASEFVHRNLLFGNGRPQRSTPSDTNWVSVKNTSGSDRVQGEIVEFTGLALTDLAARDLILTGGAVTLANGFGVLQSPVANNEITPDCQVSGACVATVNINSTGDVFAGPQASSYVLQSASSGPARILWKPSGTGNKTCIVLIGAGGSGSEVHRGITTANNNKGSSGSVTRYTDGTNSSSGITDTVNNDFVDVGNGKVIVYVKLGSNFYLIAAPCPPKDV